MSSSGSAVSAGRSLLVAALLVTAPVAAADLGSCRLPLGVTSGQIKDEAMTASSSYDENNTGPQNGRVNVERGAGAWCPYPPVARGSREFLEVALPSEHLISAVLTQGRYDRGRGVEYTKTYTLEYWRRDIGWRNYSRWNGDRILPGNTNVASVRENSLIPPIVASKVRFVPYSEHSRTVCLRVELLGCRRQDGIVSYSVRQGDLYSDEVNLRDLSFDGHLRRNFLSRGLGQLTDGMAGGDSFLEDRGYGKGYEWVGWANNASQQYPIEITFEFDAVRNFSLVSLFTNVHYSRGIQIFSLVRVFFSDGGQLYQWSPVVSYPRAVRASHETHNISVNLSGRAARFVKIQLFFSARWILISEIRFVSGVCEQSCGDFIEKGMTIPHTEVWRARPQDISKIMSMTSAEDQSGLSDGQLGLLFGLLAFLALAVLLAGGLLYWRGRRLKSGSLTYTTFSGPFGDRKVTITTKGVSGKMSLAPLANGLSEAKGTLFGRLDVASGGTGAAAAAAHTLPARPSGGGGSGGQAQGTPRDVVNGNGLVVNQLDGGTFPAMKLKAAKPRDDRNIYHSESTSELSDSTTTELRDNLSHAQSWNQHDSLRPGQGSGRESDSVRASLSSGRESESVRLSSNSGRDSTRASPLSSLGRRRRQEQVALDGRKGSSSQLASQIRGQVERFPASSLQLQERLGNGKYGELLLYQLLDDRHPPGSVAIGKCVRRNISPELSDEFREELAVCSRLRCRHLCAVLGVGEEPASILVEYSPLGDLNQFLQGHVSETSTCAGNVLSNGSLLYMASQVASGLSFLEDNGVVHRDIATRNCVVFEELQIKLTDTGSGRDLYAADYYQLDNDTRLPVRWLAWEALFLGQQSSASDAWSFAVTLWEILTFAREQPFENFSDEAVISNLALFYNNDGGHLPEYLPPPLNCAQELYDLMLECWRRNNAERPRFRQIHLFLQRMNLGYRPAESA